MSDWLWHLWNDPMRENPWSFLCLVLIVALTVAFFWWLAGWRHRRYLRRRGWKE